MIVPRRPDARSPGPSGPEILSDAWQLSQGDSRPLSQQVYKPQPVGKQSLRKSACSSGPA